MNKFFLDAVGGSLAFIKEQDFVNQDEVVSDNSNPVALPSVPFDPVNEAILSVSNIRSAVITFDLTDIADTYGFVVYAGLNYTTDPNWFRYDGGTYTGITGNLVIGVDVKGIDYLCVVYSAAPSSGSIIKYAPIPFEEAT